MILLDTHAWVWWASDPEQLSPRARKAAAEAATRHELLVSVISAWEVAMLVAKGRLELTVEVEDWVAASTALPGLRSVPTDTALAVLSVRLPGTLHPDPADRMIVATALRERARLVTKDTRLQQYPHVRTLW